MYSPPFHRRILPWIFVIAFAATAPVLVFYTAGYRWNPKKEKIERNGTLIFDTRPTGASILLNGKATGHVTPRTIQNVTPGTYRIRYELEGHHAWEKTLDVQAERVTFANDVRLWRQRDPVKVITGDVVVLEPSPNGRYVVTAANDGASSTRISVMTPDLKEERSFVVNAAVGTKPIVRWSPDSRAILLESGGDADGSAWLMNVRTGLGPMTLPEATYRWNGTLLEGNDGASIVSIRSDDGAVERVPLGFRVVDAFEDITIRTTTGTDDLALFADADASRGFIL
ncbi:PEGA domain-containing protein, partial [Candidatus Uhrbacteria bacterium]|nr:PEGA domain-containing protein [Candidatus Uhrbacteria bacterium]